MGPIVRGVLSFGGMFLVSQMLFMLAGQVMGARWPMLADSRIQMICAVLLAAVSTLLAWMNGSFNDRPARSDRRDEGERL